FTVLLDGEKVTEFTDSAIGPDGKGDTHVGLLVNNATVRFQALRAWRATPGGEKGDLLFSDDFAAGQSALSLYQMSSPAGNVQPTVPLRASLSASGDLITFSARLPDSGYGMGAQAQIRHLLENPRHVWIPHVAPEPGFVIGDHSLRAPALVFADSKQA